MKNIKNYFILALVTLTLSAIFVACSSDNDEVRENARPTDLVESERLRATICDIIGSTVVSTGSAVVAAGSTATYSYTNNTGSATTITWTLTGVGATFSGGGTTITSAGPVTVIYSSNFVSGTLSAAGSGGTAQTCNTILNITKRGGGRCVANIIQIWCSPTNFQNYNVEINVRMGVTNPFPNQASVLVQWDPAYLSGYQVAGGLYNLSPNQSTTIPSQFDTTANSTSTTGFYVPLIVKYTDLNTGAICIVKLNPLVTGGCNSTGPM